MLLFMVWRILVQLFLTAKSFFVIYNSKTGQLTTMFTNNSIIELYSIELTLFGLIIVLYARLARNVVKADRKHLE